MGAAGGVEGTVERVDVLADLASPPVVDRGRRDLHLAEEHINGREQGGPNARSHPTLEYGTDVGGHSGRQAEGVGDVGPAAAAAKFCEGHGEAGPVNRGGFQVDAHMRDRTGPEALWEPSVVAFGSDESVLGE